MPLQRTAGWARSAPTPPTRPTPFQLSFVSLWISFSHSGAAFSHCSPIARPPQYLTALLPKRLEYPSAWLHLSILVTLVNSPNGEWSPASVSHIDAGSGGNLQTKFQKSTNFLVSNI